jgi:HSP20 family protein
MMPRDVRYASQDPMFERLEKQMDDLVDRLMRRPAPAAYQRAWAPRVDLYETEDSFIAVVELPGIEPSEVMIEIEDEEIVFTGEREAATPPQGAECLQLEIPFGSFERRLTLPASVEAGAATADFNDGMLTVHLPKTRQGPKRVQVDIKRPQ